MQTSSAGSFLGHLLAGGGDRRMDLTVARATPRLRSSAPVREMRAAPRSLPAAGARDGGDGARQWMEAAHVREARER
jgi:hypothetical protein